MVTAGFPCIDVSRAGLRRGMGGQSTSLVRHVFRLLEQALRDKRGVPWVLLENVRHSIFSMSWSGFFTSACVLGELTAPLGEPFGCMQVEGLLDRQVGTVPVVQYIAEQFERLGYQSWAQRILTTAGRLIKHHHIVFQVPCIPFSRSASMQRWPFPGDVPLRASMPNKAEHLRPSAVGFGIPHQRKRCFILASLYSDARDVLLQVCIRCLSQALAPSHLQCPPACLPAACCSPGYCCLAGAFHLPRGMPEPLCWQALLLVLEQGPARPAAGCCCALLRNGPWQCAVSPSSPIHGISTAGYSLHVLA